MTNTTMTLSDVTVSSNMVNLGMQNWLRNASRFDFRLGV
jgi:hypothetical protein